MDPRLSILAAQYELYRFVWAKFTIHPSDNGTSDQVALGFLPDRPTALGVPASFAEIMELALSLYIGSREVVPRWLTITAKDLLGRTALKWWDTDTAASESTIQGRIFTRSVEAAVVIPVIFEYEIEFCNPIPATVTLERIDRFRDLGLFTRVGCDAHLTAKIKALDAGRSKSCQGANPAEPKLLGRRHAMQ
jgi:hypothetical protein